MKSRVLTFISLLALAAAMMAAPSASAQTSPAQDVYNPNGEVLDVVESGGTTPDNDSGGNPPPRESVCAEADGRDANGNSVAYGSAEDCDTTVTEVAEGELPFTGFEAGLVGLAGIALLGAGAAMRRMTRGDAS